jgi:uncharacterized protein YhaN
VRIDALHLIKFGKFTDQRIGFPQQERDFHVIVGPNEAGKSTLRAAILDVLFGIPLKSSHAFLHPLPTLRLGAQLSHGEHTLIFERAKAAKHTIRSAQDEPLDEQVLQPYLGSADRDFFTQMFSMDHTRLVRGGESILSAADDLGQLLFQSAAGLSSLGRARDALEQEANAIWAPRRSADRSYYQANAALDAATAALKHSSLRAKEFAAANAQWAQMEEQLEQVRQRHHALRVQRSQIERVRRVAPQLLALERLDEQLRQLGDALLLAPEAGDLLHAAQQAFVELALERDLNERHLHAARTAMQALAPDPEILPFAQRIQALDEQRLQLSGHAAQIQEKQQSIASIEAQAGMLLQALGRDRLPWEADTPALPGRMQRQQILDLLAASQPLEQEYLSTTQALLGRRLELEQSKARLRELASPEEPLALRLALEQAQQLGNVDQTHQQLQAALDKAERSAEHRFAALGRWRVEASRLRAMSLPALQDLGRWEQEAQHRELTLQSLLHRQAQLSAAITSAQHAHSATQSQLALVSVQALQESRQRRDALWHELVQSPLLLGSHEAEFSARLQASDELADRRFAQAERANQFMLEQRKLQGLQDDLRSLQLEAQVVQEAAVEAAKAWSVFTEACGLPSLPLSAARAWLDTRLHALEADSAVHAAREALQSVQQQTQSATQALLKALHWPASTPAPPLSLALAQAREQWNASVQQRGERLALQAQCLNNQREIDALEQALLVAEQRQATWTAQWSTALEAIGHAGSTTPTQIAGILERTGQLSELHARREQLVQRDLVRLQGQLAAYEQSVQALAHDLTQTSFVGTADEYVGRLTTRLRSALRVQEQVQSMNDRCLHYAAQLEQVALRSELTHASVAHLLQQTGAQTLDELPRWIARSTQRRLAQRDHELALQNILSNADGFSLEQLREQCLALQGQDLAVLLEDLVAQEQAALTQIEQCVSQREQAQNVMQGFTGCADAATAEAQRQEALAAMAREAERYIAVHTAAKLLRWSVDRYREQEQGPMLREASRVFGQLTQHAFVRLFVDFEAKPPTLLGQREGGQVLHVGQMSEGTRDQLYLALRIAAIDLHVRHAHALPLVADDLFINFDDERSAAGLAALGELSRRTQVIFLTHHSHLLARIEQVFGSSVNVVQL